MSNISEDEPLVAALLRAIDERGLRLSIDPEGHVVPASSWCRVLVAARDGLARSIEVDDEYGDATDENQPLLLHLVLAACECYEEAEDILEWAGEAELDASEAWVQELFSRLGELVPEIREIVGPEVRAVPAWDFTLNSGAARALRGRSSGPAR